MAVWGGTTGNADLSDGAFYDPEANKWLPIPTKNAPEARFDHKLVSESGNLFVLGGLTSNPGGTLTAKVLENDGWHDLPDGSSGMSSAEDTYKVELIAKGRYPLMPSQESSAYSEPSKAGGRRSR